MLFLLDANLSPGLGRLIADSGHECVHVAALLRPDASDAEIVSAANRLGAALITNDADFKDFSVRGELRGVLIRLRLGSMSTRATAEKLLPELPRVLAAIANGETIIEVY